MADEIRKIVAILSCDVVFEEASGAEAPIESFHEVQRELVAKHGGEWHPEAGNQALATFDAPLDAVLCAVDIQRAMGAEPGVIVRSGVHIGDLVFRKYDESTAIFGDAVNVAVRLNAVIHGSGVCVSEKVFEAVRRTRGLDFKSLGEKHLKNVNRPIRVHQVGDKSRAAKKQKSAPSPAVGPAVGTEGGTQGGTEGGAGADAANVGAGGANRRLIPIAMGVAIAIAAVAALMMSDWGTSEDPASSVREEVAPAGEEPAEALDSGSGEEIAAEAIEVEEVAEAAEALAEVDPAAAGSVVDTGDTSAEAELASFGAARRALLALDGAGRFDAALWTVPDPVKNEALYQVGFEAKCACSAVVFAVNGSADEITLLYPNPYEPPQRLVEGSPARIPSTDAWQIRAVGGEGIDVLKLVVTREALTFPSDPTEAWAATPADSAQVAELIGWLESVQAGDWDAATAPLQIIP